MFERLKSFFSENKELYAIDRPQESELFLTARDVMGTHIQKMINKNGGFKSGFAWLRKELTSPSFDDMNFSYKNKVFSLLIDLKNKDKNILPEHRKIIFNKVCLENDLIPCVFPIDVQNLTPINREWNLFHSLTNKSIDPLEVASDEKTPMSKWEFNNFAIFQVMQFICKQGLIIHSFCDAPDILPQIWFQDKDGKPSWVIVKYALYPTRAQDITVENIEELAATAPNYNRYIARIAFMPMEEGNCYRQSGFYISFQGLEKVYQAKMINN